MTDWGAHHVDIAHWALAADDTGPLSIEGTAEFPVPMADGMPTENNRYNTAHKFAVNCQFANDVTVEILAEGQNGITFYGDKGRFVVRRGALTGKPVEELVDRPLPQSLITELYKGKTPGNHMGNFFECMADRTQPVSDVWSHHLPRSRRVTWQTSPSAWAARSRCGSREARNRRRRPGQQLSEPRAAQGLRDRGLTAFAGRFALI